VVNRMVDDNSRGARRRHRNVMVEHTQKRRSRCAQPAPKLFLIAKVILLTSAAWLAHLSSNAQSNSGHTTVPASASSAQLAPETLISMKQFAFGQPVTVSRDGHYVAYVWENPATIVPERKMITGSSGGRFLTTGAPWIPSPAITIRDLKRGVDTLLKGANSAWAPAWSPTGDTLAFMADRDGSSGLWIWSPGYSSKVRRVTATPLTTAYYGTISWTPDGHSIVLASPWKTFMEARRHATQRPSPKSDGMGTLDVEVRRTGFESDNSEKKKLKESPSKPLNRLPAFESALVRVDLAKGTVHALTNGIGLDWMQPSPDGRWIAYVTMSDYERPGGRRYQSYYDLWIEPLSGGAPKRLAAGIPLNLRGPIGISWSPDGRYLAYRGRGLPTEEALYVVGIDGTLPKLLATIADASYYYTPAWEVDSRHLFMWHASELQEIDLATGGSKLICRLTGKKIRLLLNRGGATDSVYTVGKENDFIVLATDDSTFTSGFYRVARSSGEVTVLKEEIRDFGGGYIAELCIAVAPRGDTAVFTSEGASEPQELWSTDDTFRHVGRVSDLGGDVWKVPMGIPRIVQWPGPDGVANKGALLLPPNYDPHRRYPLVVWMYEQSLTKANIFGLTGQAVFNCQLLATRGIACFYPDLRWEREEVMQGLHEQVSAAIQGLVDQGVADPTRIGVEGQSSGGYDTFALVSTTPTIKAAVVCSGFVDMMLAYPYHNGQWVEEQMGVGGPPWNYSERYIANSPSFHMDQVHTPILMLQGTSDLNTTPQMDLAFDLLKHLGRTVEYRRYDGEGHAPDTWSPANQLDAAKRMLDWWAEYLTPDNANQAPTPH
jgi:dipeptidyl aminopeptidase/acylaminoacyl peptidase